MLHLACTSLEIDLSRNISRVTFLLTEPSKSLIMVSATCGRFLFVKWDISTLMSIVEKDYRETLCA